MGHDLSLQLREDSLMTKIMLKQQQQILEHVQDDIFEINRPINQVLFIYDIYKKMGDTIMHYAAYKSLRKLIDYLISAGGDFEQMNNRCLTAIDVANPETREWIMKKCQEKLIKKQREKEEKEENKSIQSHQKAQANNVLKFLAGK